MPADVPIIGELTSEELAGLDSQEGKPFVLEYSAYTRDTRERVGIRLRFHPSQTTGDYFALIEAIQNGGLNDGIVHRYISDALYDDSNREKLREFLRRRDLINPPSNVGLLFNALRDHYAQVPTLPPTGSSPPRSTARRTSSVARRSPASRSKTNRSR
jgi:hypothetical protein